MYYVKVLVAEASYHGQEPLTYSTDKQVPQGVLVSVPLRNKKVIGVVVGTTEKPHFAVKSIIEDSSLPTLPTALIKLLEWMPSYYPAPLGVITQLFLPKSLPKETAILEKSAATALAQLPDLTSEQDHVLKQITTPGLHLLHGETGSGKTRVYIELAKKQMERGFSSLILSPEIGLTSQLVAEFENVFGKDHVVLVHSELGTVKRRQTWAKILTSQEPLIIIGARSALFSPIGKLGLIVVDESHEPAYKQDQAPHYHASTVAAQLAKQHEAILILGSATPLVTDYFIASAKQRPVLRMRQTAMQASSSSAWEHSLHVVDLRNKRLFTKSPTIADELIAAAKTTLHAQEQVLFFLNRRGTARMIFCEHCGWQALCPHCDLPLVYHGDSHIVRCHTCSYSGGSPSSCPECNNPSIVFASMGTKAIEEEVRRLFPEAKIKRFDTDNKQADKIDAHYSAIKRGEIDILIGTQTLAKGLDLPKLGLVGVIAADTGLFFPDFTAQERTFQLITQVLGRVGRGHRSTKAFIQTYAPDSPLLKSVLHKEWDAFYNSELAERQKFLFPPFCYQLKLTCRRASKQVAERAATSVAQAIRKEFRNIIVEGPAPSFHERIQDKYQWQLVIKSKKRSILLEIIKSLPANWSYDIDPLNLL